MNSKLISTSPKTYLLVFDTDDEVASTLLEFARVQQLSGSQFSAIGAFRDVVLGYFDWQKKDYNKIFIHEQVEVLSLLGDIAQGDGGPKVHAHVVLGKADGTAHGGHLLEAHVRPTLEVVLVESPRHLQRQYDPRSHLALIQV
jgi:predicted DNA-binding protein with PD1-like motif